MPPLDTRAHLKKTLITGSFTVKIIKAYRLIQHLIYYRAGRRIGDYPSVPEEMRKIGFFDTERRVHADEGYEKYFLKENLYSGEEFKESKSGRVYLSFYAQKVYLCKRFTGLKNIFKFYNELICLDRLKNEKGIPNICFVDYKTCTLCIEYIYGINLAGEHFKKKLAENEIVKPDEEGFIELVKKIHEKNIIIYDIKDDNMMIKSSEYWIFDFGDSIYFSSFFEVLYKPLKKNELMNFRVKIREILNDCMLFNK